MSFASEADLVRVALSSSHLRDLVEPMTCPLVLEEPRGLFGRPDAVFTCVVSFDGDRWICGETRALEMKLRNWKRALTQAFRYRSFAHVSYVVLDAAHARPAIRSLDRFRRSNVGLVTIDLAGNVTVYFDPEPGPPVCGRMVVKLSDAVALHIDDVV